MAKPDGVLVVHADRVPQFLHPLPIGHLWGVGEQTAAVLERLGLKTIGDVAACPPSVLERALGSHGAGPAQLATSQQIVFERQPEWGAAETALDRVRMRFGEDALGFGALLEDG